MLTLLYILLVVGFMIASGILLSHLETRRNRKRMNKRWEKMIQRDRRERRR